MGHGGTITQGGFPGADVATDEALFEAIRSKLGSINHAGADCEYHSFHIGFRSLQADITRQTPPAKQVTQRLLLMLVFGIEGLRVLVSSSLAFVPRGHTQGPTYGHAEKLVQDVLNEHEGAWKDFDTLTIGRVRKVCIKKLKFQHEYYFTNNLEYQALRVQHHTYSRP